MSSLERLVKKTLQVFIKVYSYAVSPFLGRNCRFYPTCSAYAHEALDVHGVLKGLFLATRRILRCHPWSGADMIDPVPKRFAWRDILGYKRRAEDAQPSGANEKNDITEGLEKE